MKKNLLFCFFSIGFIMLTHAQQLQHSTWTRVDTYLINDTIFLHFTENTCTCSTSDGLLVSSTFTEEGNTFTVIDVSGPFACSNSVVGTYTFTIINGTSLDFTLVSDACSGRANSLTADVFKRMPPKTIHIPADFPHIQQGIAAADNMDTVLVAPGTYFENINFMGKKPLVVASQFILDGDTNHITNTIINGSQPLDPDKGSVVTFESGEDTTSVLCGFTITGGTGTFIEEAGNARFGGGVFIVSGGKLLNNHIEYNTITNNDWTAGGGVCANGPFVPQPWVVLRGNIIRHNKSISINNQALGGGIECWYNLIMIGNKFSYNEAKGKIRGDGGGGRISGNFGPIKVDIRNNLITHNKAVSLSDMTDIVISGGLDIFYNISGNVSNNVISYNETEVPNGRWSYGAGAMVEEITVDDFIFENNLIIGNKSISGNCLGGGLCIFDGNGIFQNNAIQNNNGSHGGGIGIGYNAAHKAVLINNTITGNSGNYGGGLFTTSANAVVINSIIWGNTAPMGTSIYTTGSTLEVRYSDVEGDAVWPGEGNVNCHATFLEDGYHLSDTCQLVEKGIASILINGNTYKCPTYDIDGEGRPMNNFPEIGADEVLMVSVTEPKPANSLTLNIYPNPASDMLTISLPKLSSNAQLTLFNITGEKLLEKQITQAETQLDISMLPKGMYFLRLQSENNGKAAKIIKD
jgi:hypothetical protein